MPHVPATDEFASPREIVALLRRELAGHNLRVVLLAIFTAAAAALLWSVLFFVAQWLTLLFLTSARGVDTPIPREFPQVFFTIAGGLIAFAWIDRRLHPDDRPRDKRSGGEVALDFLLAVPRVTLAVFSTLSAWQRLSRSDLAQAAQLLERLHHERRLRLQSVPLEIPHERRRERILYALQLVEFIDVQREDGDYWVKLNPLRPRPAASHLH